MIRNTFRMGEKTFTYTEINLNIIYMATDYSMYTKPELEAN